MARSLRNDEFESVLTADLRAAHERADARTMRKYKRVKLRISERDLELLQTRALREGIVQTVLNRPVLQL